MMKKDNDQLLECDFDFVFSSPEKLVGDLKWRDMLQSEVYQKRLKALVVDEAHTVLLW